MNTTGQPHGQEPGKVSNGQGGARADTLDVVLLILTILVLTGAAVGIVIGFPQALEIVAAQAHAAVAAAADAQLPQEHDEAADENRVENEPFIADDLRGVDAVYAAAGAGAAAIPALQAYAAGLEAISERAPDS